MLGTEEQYLAECLRREGSIMELSIMQVEVELSTKKSEMIKV